MKAGTGSYFYGAIRREKVGPLASRVLLQPLARLFPRALKLVLFTRGSLKGLQYNLLRVKPCANE